MSEDNKSTSNPPSSDISYEEDYVILPDESEMAEMPLSKDKEDWEDTTSQSEEEVIENGEDEPKEQDPEERDEEDASPLDRWHSMDISSMENSGDAEVPEYSDEE